MGRLGAQGAGSVSLEPLRLWLRLLEGGADGSAGPTEEPVPVVDGVLVLRHALAVQTHLNKSSDYSIVEML